MPHLEGTPLHGTVGLDARVFDAARTTVFCDIIRSKPATFGEAFTHLPSMPPDKIREPGGSDAPAMVQATGKAALHIRMEQQEARETSAGTFSAGANDAS